MSVTDKPNDAVVLPVSETTTIPQATSLGVTMPATAAVVTTEANLKAEYVVGGTPFWLGGLLRALPWAIDDLTANFGDSIYERMLWDPHIKAAHSLKKKTIIAHGIKLSSPVSDKHDPEYQQAQEILDFCRLHLFAQLERPIESVLLDMLDAHAFGNKIAELVWMYAEVGADQTPRYVLKAIKPKARHTVSFVSDRYLNVVGILSVVPGTGAPALVGAILGQVDASAQVKSYDPTTQMINPVNILPRQKFLILINESRDSDPRGVSDFRAAYTAWWGKMQLIPEYLKYLAQYGTPSIVGYTAPGAATITTIDPVTKQASATTPQQMMLNAILQFRNSSAMAFPYGSKIELVHSHTPVKAFADDFDFFNNEMAMAILHQQLLTGSSGAGGGRDYGTTAQVHQDSFLTVVAYAKIPLAYMLQHDLYQTAIAYNFGPHLLHLTPKVSLGKVPQPDRAATLASYGQLGLEVVPSQFADIYEALDLPEASPEDIQRLTDRANNLALGVTPTRPTPQQLAVNPPIAGTQLPGESGGVTTRNNVNNRSKSSVSNGRSSR